MKMRNLSFTMISFFLLIGCSNPTNTNIDPILKYMSEEEQFEISDIVCLASYKSKVKTEEINSTTYTIYAINVLETYKGKSSIDYVYLFGDTTNGSSVSTSLDEWMEEDTIYKLYLKEKDNKYFTTAGYQSIVKQKKS